MCLITSVNNIVHKTDTLIIYRRNNVSGDAKFLHTYTCTQNPLNSIPFPFARLFFKDDGGSGAARLIQKHFAVSIDGKCCANLFGLSPFLPKMYVLCAQKVALYRSHGQRSCHTSRACSFELDQETETMLRIFKIVCLYT